MRDVLRVLLLPQRLAEAVVEGLPRAVSALERINTTMVDMDRRLATLDDLPDKIEGLQDAFDRANDEIARLRHGLRPMVSDIDDVKEAVEPIQPAAERLGRLAERLPGGGTRG
jgi:ABC-type transporter Mla subunit MlaD